MSMGRTLGALGALVALVVVSCDRGPVLASPPPAGPFVSGTPVFEANGWIEYVPGDAPLIIVAPHGGRSRPFRLPERKCEACIDGNDVHTTELARLVADSFATRTGRRPHLVLNLLDRSKLDANRDLLEASAGNHALEPTWNWLHASIDSAKAAAIRQAGRGLVIDLHKHAHKIDRVEVGYLLAAYTFQQSDETIIAETSGLASSINSIAANSRTGDSFAAMHNGPNSMGGLLAAAGLLAVPSPADRAPKPADEYFTGGYNTYRHGSAKGGPIDAMQLEMPEDVIGDKPENLQRVAGILATALAAYLERHYGWK
jgi:N-formylglutamate amidohydrolase